MIPASVLLSGIIAFGSNKAGNLDVKLDTQLCPIELESHVAELPLQQIAPGLFHTLALTAQGKVYAWGSNRSGQLGDGTHQARQRPVRVDGELALKCVTQVACGSSHSLALTDQGEVYAWGANRSGQLGDGTYTTRELPVRVRSDGSLLQKEIVQIATGKNRSLALTSTGEVYQWGLHGSARLEAFPMVTRLAPDFSVLTRQGAMYMLSYSDHYRHARVSCCPPERVPAPHRIVQTATANQMLLALTDQGKVFIWHHANLSLTPLAGPIQTRRVTRLAAGSRHCLFLTDQGEVFGWGSNARGQLGLGDGVEVLYEAQPLLRFSVSRACASRLRIAAGGNASFVWTL